MSAVIEIEGLTKDYPAGFWVKRTVRALDGLTLTVEAGEIFGFLGPNGAGKTTTLKLLMRIVHPTSGKAHILGHPLGHPLIYQSVGYLPEHPYFYDYLTAEELLLYFARLLGMPRQEAHDRARQVMTMLRLNTVRDVQLRKFSKGMLQRMGIAQAILNSPRVLFLDEPFSGLDPIGRRELRDIVKQLNTDGVTVFFSSHILSDVESLCDRFAMLHRGRLLDSGKLRDVLQRESQMIEIYVNGLSPSAGDVFRREAREIEIVGDRLRLVLDRGPGLSKLIHSIENAGGRIATIHNVRSSLEDFFVRQIEQDGGEAGSQK